MQEAAEHIFAHLNIGYIVCVNGKVLEMNQVARKLCNTEEEAICYLEEAEKKHRILIDGRYYQIEKILEESEKTIYIIKDVTEITLYEAYMDAFEDVGIMVIDENETITYANKISKDYDKFQNGEFIGMKFKDFSPEIVNSALLDACRTRKKIENRQMEHNIPNIPRELGSAYPIYIDGNFRGAVSILFFNRWINNLLNTTSALQIEYRDQRKANRNKGYVFEDILGQDPEIQKTKRLAMRVCNTAAPVMIYGETGTGKELFAQSIHNASAKRDKPFIGINCAAIPETLLESTLFGTEKGAFTGAVTSAGLFEQAKDGTLFLDEINSMPVNLQVKLLRVIQERVYRRVGGSQQKQLNCRILSACNQQPKKCIEMGSMRDDLYYRLAAVQLNTPPLRERGKDIILLAENAVHRYSEIYGMNPELTDEVKIAFLNYAWPGNVREMNHVIESTMLLLENENEITLSDLPQPIQLCANPHCDSVDLTDIMDNKEEKKTMDYELKDSLANYERNNILMALEKNDYNISRTARELGYSRSNLQYRMKKLNITIKKK